MEKTKFCDCELMKRELSGKPTSLDDPEYPLIKEVISDTIRITQEMNTAVHTREELLQLFAELTSTEVNETLSLLPPFRTDYGKHIKIGERVFINAGCFFMDRGSITIGDDCFIGPQVMIITITHGIKPEERRMIYAKPIHIGNNVWIGAGAIVLPGITVGDNAVVGAGAVVTKDVPANCIVTGNPATILRKI